MYQVWESAIGNLLNKGQELFDQENYESAICQYIKVMQTNPLRYQYFCERGVYFTELGKNQSAIHNFIQQYHMTAQDLAQYLRGMAVKFMNQYLDAISNFTQIIQRCPQFKYCYNDRGNTHRSLLELEQAIEDYSDAINLGKEYEQAYYNRGLTLCDLGRKEEAIQDYTRTIEINPQNDEAYYNRGVILGELGRKEEAIQDYTRAIEISPQNEDAFYNRGNLLNDLGRKQYAIQDYARAIEINPQKEDAFFNRGNVLNDLGRKEYAIQDYTRAIEINPKEYEAYLNRGNTLSDLGRKEQAIKDYTRAIEINPQKDEALYNRGQVMNNLGRKEQAYKDYQNAHQIQPQNPLYNIQLGLFLLSNGDKQKAYQFFVQGLKLAQQLSQKDKKKFHVQEGNLAYIYQQIEQEISKVNQLIRSKPLSENEQNILLEQIKPIEAQFQQQMNQPLKKDDNDIDNKILQQILKVLNELTEKVIKLENQRPQRIMYEMIQLKQDDNKLFNYISACQLLTTYLFQQNTDAMIDYDKERLAQIISKVVQQIFNKAGSVPIVGTVITIISSVLEFAFSNNLDYKFNQIVKKLTQNVQERCASNVEIDEEIQLAIIQQSKQLGELTQDKKLKEQGLLEHVQQIQQEEENSGNQQAQHPYWKQGVVDTLRILRNLLANQQQIQLDNNQISIQLDKLKELHIVILESLKDEEWQVGHHQVATNSRSWCERCCSWCEKCCKCSIL